MRCFENAGERSDQPNPSALPDAPLEENEHVGSISENTSCVRRLFGPDNTSDCVTTSTTWNSIALRIGDLYPALQLITGTLPGILFSFFLFFFFLHNISWHHGASLAWFRSTSFLPSFTAPATNTSYGSCDAVLVFCVAFCEHLVRTVAPHGWTHANETSWS